MPEYKKSLLQTIGEGIRYAFSDDVVKKIEEPFDSEKEVAATEEKTTQFGDPKLQDFADVDVISGSNYASLFMPSYASEQTLDELMKLYRQMAGYSYVNQGIWEIVNSAIVQTDDATDVVKIDFNDKQDKIPKKIKDSIFTEFNNILTIMDFDVSAPDLFRQWFVDGRLLLQVVVNPNKLAEGILNIYSMSPLNLKRQYNKREKKVFYVYDESKNYDMYGKKLISIIPEDLVVFVPSGVYETERRIPVSYLHYALKDINRLNTLEDHFLIYRIVRSPERRVFYIDPGNLPPKKAEEYLRQVIAQYRQKKIFDEQTGTIQSRVKHPSIIEDFFMLRREGKGTAIETIGSADALQTIDDLLYFQRKAARALRVPWSRINYEDRKDQSVYENDSMISAEENRFLSYIRHLRTKFSVMFYELLKRQLIFKNIIKIEEWENIKKHIKVIWRSDDEYVLKKKMNSLNKKLEVLGTASQYEGKYMSREDIYKQVLCMTDEEIESLEKKLIEEKSKYKSSSPEAEGGLGGAPVGAGGF